MKGHEKKHQNHNLSITNGKVRLVTHDLLNYSSSELEDKSSPLTLDNYYVQKPVKFVHCYATDVCQTIKFDTLKLAIPDKIITKSSKNGKVMGLQYMGYDYKRKREIWQISAKILKGNYFDLIHKGNISCVIDAINHSGLLEVQADKFYQNVKVLRADFTCDIKVTNIQELLFVLVTCCIKSNYQRVRYQRGAARETVLFLSTSGNKNSMCFYDKYTELLRHPQDEILQHINLEDARNLLRIECRCRKFDGFRSLIGMPQLNHSLHLNDLLETNTNVFLTLFNQIIDFSYYTENATGKKQIAEEILQIPKLNESYKTAFWYLVYGFYSGNKDDIDSFLRVRFKRPSIAKEQLSKYLPKVISHTGQSMKSKIADLIRILNAPYKNNNCSKL